MFYDKFLKLCENNNIKPSVAAVKIGLDKSMPSYWKKGADPKIETIIRIAKYFNVSVDYLLGDEWDASLTDDEIELIADYNKLTVKGKEIARERVRELTEIPRYYDPDNGVKIIKGNKKQDDTDEK